ncbi:hypothetical protein [Nocardia sp. NPDC005366]|uniref:SMP-30/gluconolactonase/LRE family protein n=1 Tax=Nocardia sp. NPDC005366 TaxID=3156878 RepID=UPI0033A7D3F9
MTTGSKSGRIRAAILACAVAVGGLAGMPATTAEPIAASCAEGWTADTVVSGVGNLENLDSDGHGGFYVTGILDGYLAHVDAAGRFEKVVTGLNHPAGVRVVGDSVYFLTGDGAAEPPGTLARYDIGSGMVTTLLTGLNGPNGLLVLPDGDLLFSALGLVGPPTGISRYRPSTGEYTVTWSSLPWSNGLALAPDGVSIFTDSALLNIYRIPLDAPNNPTVVTGVPRLPVVPDDMEATRAGALFVADHVLGAVYQVDTVTGAACTIITGLIKDAPPLQNPPHGATSVRIVRDGETWCMYVTSMDGTLRRLRPPPGLDLTPADPRR